VLLPLLSRAVSWPLVALVLVAALWIVLQRSAMELNFPLGYDEAVYVSQVSTRPHMYWSAPRAFGLPLLLWPLVHFTTSTVALRVYVSVLTAVGLVLAYLPWIRVRAWTAVVAALLFSSLWVSTYYGSLAMPNLVTALAAVAAVGWMVRSLDDVRLRSAVAVTVALSVMSLVRPSDATYLALPSFIALAVIRATPLRARLRIAVAVAVGTAVGWGFWVVEAFVNFGGPLQRLHDAGSQDGGGLHWNLPFYSHVISGPTACCVAIPISRLADVWWWALWPVAILGVVLAQGSLRRAYLLCLAAAATVFAQYLFLIKVEAPGPRTLLPVYALLAVPVAHVAVVVIGWRPRTLAGGLAIAGLVVGFGGYAILQQHVVRLNVRQQRSRQSTPRLVSEQLRAAGVSAPCLLAGPDLPEVAYQTGCHQLRRLPTAAEIARARQTGTQLAVLLWAESDIADHRADYDRALVGFNRTALPRDKGISYVWRPAS
jgi:hypothetical protein